MREAYRRESAARTVQSWRENCAKRGRRKSSVKVNEEARKFLSLFCDRRLYD